jgi:hypothetical protein
MTGEPPSLNSERRSQGDLTMFNLFSRFRSNVQSRQHGAFNSSTTPSQTIALANDRSVIVYDFEDEHLLFDARCNWRFIGSLPIKATRAIIVLVAEAYFRGFEQGQGEWSELGLSDEFLAMARDYETEMAHRPKA